MPAGISLPDDQQFVFGGKYSPGALLKPTLGSTIVAGFGISDLLIALICRLSQNQLAQGYVDTQGMLLFSLVAVALRQSAGERRKQCVESN